MNKIKEKIKNIHYMHYICFGITLSFVMLSIFVFPNAFVRIKEAVIDLWNSIKYYVRELFYLDYDINISVNDYSSVPFTPFFNLPATWEEFTIKWGEYWKVFATKDNLLSYFSYVGQLIYNMSRIILLIVIPLFLILYLLFQRYLKTENNDYNKDSKPLTYFKWLTSKVYIPIKLWAINFISFIKQNNKWFKIWLFVWLFNFNFITIVIEFIAFYLYFVMAFDFVSIYKQVYKLFCDISVLLAFVPSFCWFIISYLFICWFRKRIGYNRLNHMEHKNCGFVNERPIVSMVVGLMGKNKTTEMTDMGLSQEVMFRNEALNLMIKNDMKFPNFPWVNLENSLRYAIDKHIIYNLTTIKLYIKHLEICFLTSEKYKQNKSIIKSIKRHLKKRFNINFSNFIFDYDLEKYDYYYDDNLKVIDIWETITSYSQLYFIYVFSSSLIVSNYAVRTDNILSDIGNLPMWDSDFFFRDSKSIDQISKHSHIVDFDMLRLGKKMIEDNKKKDCFEFGVVLVTEIGKERKNNLELHEQKKKDFLANQKNDGFNDYLKMCRHNATVDNFPFIKFVTDEQRPESWGADARELCEIINIAEVDKNKLAMPLFFVEELIYSVVYSKFVSLYCKYRFVRSDNTLFMYLYKKIVGIIYNFYHRTYNTFGYHKQFVEVEKGTQDGEILTKKYYLMFKKIYSRRFKTDCFGDFFKAKALRSKIGLNDIETYKTEQATFDELKIQNSYFINELMEKKEKDK